MEQVLLIIQCKYICLLLCFRSFGVALWEVLEFGKQPYDVMSDEEVLQKVVKLRAVGLNTTAAEDHKALYVQVDVDREDFSHYINVNFLDIILMYSF